MLVINHPELELRSRFLPHRKRHLLNDQVSALHCHHYTTLYTQLAMDAKETTLLMEVAEDSFYEVLCAYFAQHPTPNLADKIELVEQYYQAMGMGIAKVVYLGKDGGQVELHTSQLDVGWLKKWGQHDEPVNYISAGYFAAVWAVIQNAPVRTFYALETQSIVMGAATSQFKIARR